MKPVILFRGSLAEEEELEAAKKYFDVYESRTAIPKNSLVIGRYSCLPYYKELVEDLEFNNSKLINSYWNHQYVADLKNWYQDLRDVTPKTWFYLKDVANKKGPFVLKGATNSKKFQWKTMMYGKDYLDAAQIYLKLCEDSLVGQQDIYIREYVPLKEYKEFYIGVGPPITEEYRFFFYKGKLVDAGFYWSNHYEAITETKKIKPHYTEVPSDWLRDEVVDKIKDNINFVVVDVARTKSGEWIVIELNDGQQSGLSCIDPDNFYKNLKEVIENEV